MSFFYETFIFLFILIDPVMLAPVFVALTEHHSEQEKKNTATRAFWIALGVLATLAFGGQEILHHLGISLGALKVSGGILLLLMGLPMVFSTEETPQESLKKDVALVPLAMPLLAGPSAFTGLMIKTKAAAGNLTHIASIYAAILLVMLCAWGTMRLAPLMTRYMNKNIVAIMNRMVGLIIVTMATQLMLEGIQGFYFPSQG